MADIERWVVAAAEWAWGLPLLVLITGGGLYFLVLSRFLPFRHPVHALGVLAGKHDDPDDPGQVSHYQALSVALAATVGMGNISGVAIAIAAGGPGIVFWMWVSAVVGMATKYFTCSLAVMYRGRDSRGELQGGPMYVISEGLGPRWKPLAILFCVAGAFGCLPVFNANQLTQAVRDIALVPLGVDTANSPWFVGSALVVLTGLVVSGGLRRIGHAVSALVPLMVVVYFVLVAGILVAHAGEIGRYLELIFTDAFRAEFYGEDALFGSALGGLIVLGARRAAFSNEAGLGTAAMAHGAARTSEPVHEGLVAMLGPAIDTLIVCTLTALAILVTGVWETSADSGVTLTATAFVETYPRFGGELLLICIACFSLSSLFSYAYFGAKCFGFLFGADKKPVYTVLYVASILGGAVSSMALILNFIDLMFAIMAIPTVLSAVLLAPRVAQATRAYWQADRNGNA
ncbi:MAG: alanine:cation symporter family protein [bacterium]|nr:alanine:cation symporter family protein [bacterium]